MRKPLLATILVLAWLSPSLAQNNFVTPGGSEVDGKVEMCLNGSNQAVPCGTPTNPVTTTPVPYGNTPVPPSQMGLGIVASTALTVPATATWALIVIEGAPVRWRDDGTAPTATVGTPLSVGQTLTLNGAAELAAVRFIQQSATATIDVSYYK